MKNPNFLLNRNKPEEEEVTWDSLKEVPFRGERNPIIDVKETIRKKLVNISGMVKREPMTIQTFMLLLIGDLQPILANNDVEKIYDNFDYWKESLGVIYPILAGFWAECDPMIISYLYYIFVAQFIVILELWEQIDFSDANISDCAMMGEYFVGTDMMLEDILLGMINRWGLNG